MKRLLVILTAVMMVAGMAGNAMAAFEAGNLVLVAYEGDHSVITNGNEAFYDLGATAPVDGSVFDTGISLADFDTNTWGDIKIALVGGAVNDIWQPDTPIYFSADSDPSGVYVGNTSTFSNAYTALVGDSDEIGYGDAVVGNKAIMPKNAYGSYSTFFNGGANAGYYATAINAGYHDFGAEEQLGDTGIFETYLYTSMGNETPTMLGTLTLDTSSGSLVVNYSAVPVPGAFVLLGSALLGMIGIRRKNS